MIGIAQARQRIVRLPVIRVLNWIVLAAGLVIALIIAQRIAAHGLGYFLQTVIYGLAGGSLYALIALGYTMVYGIIELINFAHADVFTFGGFVSLTLVGLFGLKEGVSSGPIVIVLLILITAITMLVCGGLNIAIERVAYRPLRNAPRLSPLITAVGMSFILEGVMFIWKGPTNNHFPDLLPSASLSLLGVSVRFKDVAVVVVAGLLVAALNIFIRRSKLGKAMRATAQDRDAASLMGININRTIAATFFIGAVLAGAGGTAYGLYFNNVVFDLGFTTGLIAFTSAVLGGIGNIPGAALGAMCIGMFEALWNGYLDSAWTQVMIFVILALVLLIRPSGLLGARVPDRV
ncbi:MAG: branched-chain amino acid ABC transporter permease [Candidatus Dormibacteraeota bacterium]|nr:branched-chain amino acid ABC transporter permease [Candidatus Dormibacteraeota bacterium]